MDRVICFLSKDQPWNQHYASGTLAVASFKASDVMVSPFKGESSINFSKKSLVMPEANMDYIP